jgi:hypothetical protein
LAEHLLVYPVFDKRDITRHPFHFATMRHYQQRSDVTKQLLINLPEQYALVTLRETDLICYIANPQQPKIVLTDDKLPRIVRYYHLTSPSQRQSPLASQLIQNMSENEAVQYQLRATSCLRGNKCSLGTSTRGSHWSMEHQGQRTQETSAIYCPDMYRPGSQSTRGWNSQGQDVRTSYKDIQAPMALTLSLTKNIRS